MSYTRFEWDEAKNRRNTRKHGLSFSTAASIFEHPHLVNVDTHSSNSIRIISARKATRRECERFEEEIRY